MANVIVTIRPTTEVEAVNVMLGAIGEAPLASGSDLTALSASDANVEAAVNILRETTREVLTAGWRFNTLTAFELVPAATYSWLDTAGVTTLLNIFKKPVDALAWAQAPTKEMQDVDLVERMSLKYQETGAAVLVLFDRVKNRDGVTVTDHPHIYIDVVSSVDFANMPECARRYATTVAARRMAARVPVSQVQTQLSAQDEMAALRVLKREQGLTQPLNLFTTGDSFDILGRRPYGGGGFAARTFPGGS